jgi:hypothetical protein
MEIHCLHKKNKLISAIYHLYAIPTLIFKTNAIHP